MYVYLPAFGEGAAESPAIPTDQGFLGLAFSQGDLATHIIRRTVCRPDRLADSGSICARADGQRRAETQLYPPRSRLRSPGTTWFRLQTQILQRRGALNIKTENPFEL